MNKDERVARNLQLTRTFYECWKAAGQREY
jgi:hypothetical protein